MPTWTKHRSDVALAVQRGDLQAADEARTRLKAARAEDYIKQLVDSAPPLSDSQRARLAFLLLNSGAAA